jgi:hypothetical protein
MGTDTSRPARDALRRKALLVAGVLLALGPPARPAAGQVQLDRMVVVRGRDGRPREGAFHPQQTRKARLMFRNVVGKYPRSASAPMAQYYAAVISDFCLHERQTALTEYTAFLTKFRGDPAFVARAKKRIAELRRPAS